MLVGVGLVVEDKATPDSEPVVVVADEVILVVSTSLGRSPVSSVAVEEEIVGKGKVKVGGVEEYGDVKEWVGTKYGDRGCRVLRILEDPFSSILGGGGDVEFDMVRGVPGRNRWVSLYWYSCCSCWSWIWISAPSNACSDSKYDGLRFFMHSHLISDPALPN